MEENEMDVRANDQGGADPLELNSPDEVVVFATKSAPPPPEDDADDQSDSEDVMYVDAFRNSATPDNVGEESEDEAMNESPSDGEGENVAPLPVLSSTPLPSQRRSSLSIDVMNQVSVEEFEMEENTDVLDGSSQSVESERSGSLSSKPPMDYDMTLLFIRCVGCPGLFSSAKELRYHCNEVHKDDAKENFLLSMCQKGLISCQICGTMLEWNMKAVFSHCKEVHQMEPKEYLQLNKNGFDQTDSDRKASEMAYSLKCQECSSDSEYNGVRSWHLHNVTDHAERVPEDFNDTVVGMIADQLGVDVVTRCSKCKAAVAQDLAQKHLKFECRVVKTDEDRLTQSAFLDYGGVKFALTGMKKNGRRQYLACPLCSKTVSGTNYYRLREHFLKAHKESPMHSFEQSVLESHGFISCRVCFTVCRKQQMLFNHHLKCHGISSALYYKNFGLSAFEQTDSEKGASRLARKLKCPFDGDPILSPLDKDGQRCEGVVLNIFQLRDHIKAAHHSRAKFFSTVLFLASDQLGLDRCHRCKSAISRDPETKTRHMEVCGQTRSSTLRDSKFASPLPDVHKSFIKENETDRQVQRFMNGENLLSCRLCGIVRLAKFRDWRHHLIVGHSLTISEYIAQTKEQMPLTMSDEEKAATEKLKNLKCQICGEIGLTGLREYSDHLKKCHPRLGHLCVYQLIGLVANQLGFARCYFCQGASLKSKFSDHKNYHTSKRQNYYKDMLLNNSDVGKAVFDTCENAQNSATKQDSSRNGHSPANSSSELNIGNINENEDRRFQRFMKGKSLLGCRLCGVVRRLRLQDWRGHLWITHKLTISQYLSLTEKDKPLTMNAEEEKAAHAVQNIECPRCSKSGIPGLDAYYDHLKTDHNVRRVSSFHLIGHLAKQLGFTRCISCKGAILRDKMKDHQKIHTRRNGMAKFEDTTENSHQVIEPTHYEIDRGDSAETLSDTMSGTEGRHKDHADDFGAIKNGGANHDMDEANLQNRNFEKTEIDSPSSPHSSFESASSDRCVATNSYLSIASQSHQLTKETFPNNSNDEALDLSLRPKDKIETLEVITETKQMDTNVILELTGSSQDQSALLVRLRTAILAPKCQHCQDRYLSWNELRAHYQTTHAKDSSWETLKLETGKMLCGLCGDKIIADYKSLEKHLVQTHSGKSLTCQKYLQEYEIRFVGHPHVKHPLLMSICPWCGDASRSMESLRIHVEEKHSGDKDDLVLQLMTTFAEGVNFSCQLCDMQISMSYKALEEHIAKKHPNLQLSRFLDLFYDDIKMTWEDQMFGKEFRSQEANNTIQKKVLPKGSDKTSTFIDAPLDVIDLCSSDEDDDDGENEALLGKENEERTNKGQKQTEQDDGSDLPSELLTYLKPVDSNMSFEETTATNYTSDAGTCTYSCPKCKMGGFGSLSLATAHIKRVHQGDVESLMALKGSRIERHTNCRICGKRVLCDSVDLGYHLWTEHNLPLDAYDSM